MDSERISESPVSSPDIDYYEECVVAEEDIVSSVKLADRSPSILGKNKNSGRVMKKTSKFENSSRCGLTGVGSIS